MLELQPPENIKYTEDAEEINVFYDVSDLGFNPEDTNFSKGVGMVSNDLSAMQEVYGGLTKKDVDGSDFIRELRDRVLKKDKNLIITIVGATGSGKSFASLKLAEELMGGPGTFPIDQCAFSSKEFTELVNANLPKGSVIIFEEVGYNYSNRKWQSNFGNNAIMQTFRHQNLITIMNTPDNSFIDKQARLLTHAIFKMVDIDHSNKQSIMRPYFLNVNPVQGHVSTGFTVMSDDLISEIRLGLPSKPLVKDYEKKKKEFTSGLNQGLLNKYSVDDRKAKIAEEKEKAELYKDRIDEYELDDEALLFRKDRRKLVRQIQKELK